MKFTKLQKEKIEAFRVANEEKIYNFVSIDWRWTPSKNKSCIIVWQRKNQPKHMRSEMILFSMEPGKTFENK